MLETLVPTITIIGVIAVLVWLWLHRDRKDEVARCDRCHKPFGTSKIVTINKQYCLDCDARIKSEWARHHYEDPSQQEKN
jgi:hypothetical protein